MYLMDVPDTTKETEGGTGNGLEYAVAAMQGWRQTMEDAHVADVKPAGLPEGFSLFAIFDGHCGHLTAQLASQRITEEVANALKSISSDGKLEVESSRQSNDALSDAMRKAFVSLDKSIRDTYGKETFYGVRSGSTAVVALITPKGIVVANAGDSRCFLFRDGETVKMSRDHKPWKPKEYERIINAGGTVWDNRVDGDLSVSRGLGDFRYKTRTDLPAAEQQVSCSPDVIATMIDNTEEFLVLACDGVCDVMSNYEVCDFIRKRMAEGKADLKQIAEEVLDQCVNSHDNASIVIVKFPGAKIGEGGGVQEDVQTVQNVAT
ncbi:unnamed protein product [Peronospora belbahrii]|uniref:protein-serine/threonine phosphatase n=1 Tax=Peronospora belbahrii TaxID=622444 RepID=A0AAU9KWT1_9STRA|nr:unnamed protein product [Peronospora belbahrii]CAH0477728.1 unnamed protein product [Peronospora belbahrii]CAH0517158.1 unnamed protein product [Peronospora belbahrii]